MTTQQKNRSTLLAAVTLAGAIAVPVANASSNPFSNTELSSGFNLEHAKDHKGGGEGKCGDAKQCPEGKCGEGKCGEQCANKSHDDHKSSADDKSATDDKSAAEGKCGEGKCGESMSSGDSKTAK